MATFHRDDIDFHYLEKGTGSPFFFQHGLGGDATAVWSLLETPPGFRTICMDFRGHGQTRPLGNPDKLGFDAFADDLLALMGHLGYEHAIVGGTSMGAGVALNCALRYPGSVLGLVLLRPAWLDRPRPENVALFALIAELLRHYGPVQGLKKFQESPLCRSVAEQSSDSAGSLAAQFSHPRALETVAKLERIPQDCPGRDQRAWRSIAIPTLVLANRSDPIHPFEYGQTLAREIPGATFKEVTPKSVDLSRYTQDVRACIAAFFQAHFPVTANLLS